MEAEHAKKVEEARPFREIGAGGCGFHASAGIDLPYIDLRGGWKPFRSLAKPLLGRPG